MSEIPAELLLNLLRFANDDDDLDCREDELLGHYRTETYRAVIEQAYAAGYDRGVDVERDGLSPEEEYELSEAEAASRG